jgi:sugar-specific transcriptional regulator TrmB
MNGDGVEQLVELGLTGYEAAAYLALIRRNGSTAAEVARLAELPRQRIYDVLDGLVSHGLAALRPGRPTHYTAVAPDVALGRLLARRREHLEQLERDVDATLGRLGAAFKAGQRAVDPLDFIEVVREPTAIAQRFADLQAAAEGEILVFTKPPYAVDPAENVEGLELLRRGIVARSVYERSVYDDDAQVGAVRAFIAEGEQARVVEELPLKLVVIDERVALFTLEDPVAGEPGLTIMIVEHAALARLLKVAFEATWERGMPF